MSEFAARPFSAAAPWGGARRTGLALVLVPALALAWAALVRAPFLNVEGLDDSFYVEVGHLWAKGFPPYVGAYDVKPPGFFWLVALAERIVGPSVLALRLVSILSDAVTAAALFGIGRRIGSLRLGAFAALLYPALSLLVHGSEAYAPLEAATALAFLAALSDGPILRRALLAGLAAGAACAIKQTAALQALATFSVVFAAPAAGGRRAIVGLTFIAAAAAAPLGFLVYFASQGAAGALIDQAVVGALLRPSSAAVDLTFAQGLARFWPLQRSLLPLELVAVLALALHRNIRVQAPRAPVAALAGWLAAGWIEIIVQRSMTITYLGPIIAPSLLLAGLAVTAGSPWKGRAPQLASLAALALATVSMAVTNPGAKLANRVPRDALEGAIALVEKAGPTANDKMLVVNRGVLLNAMLDLDPPTRTIFTAHRLCDFTPDSAKWLADDLAARPRFIVVADRTRAAVCELKSGWAAVDFTLARGYRSLGRADGVGERFELFERAAPTAD